MRHPVTTIYIQIKVWPGSKHEVGVETKMTPDFVYLGNLMICWAL